MNLSLSNLNEDELKKEIFHLKPTQQDGLIMRVHRSGKNTQTTRFHYACFAPSIPILAIADADGNVFIVDFINNKFWGLPSLGSCTYLTFNVFNKDELMVALKEGPVFIADIERGCFLTQLIGHSHPVVQVSFSTVHSCVTNTTRNAIIWDLNNHTKLHVLKIKNCLLKFVHFMPVTNMVLACYDDDIINVWRNHSFQSVKVLTPDLWNAYQLKYITFSKNGLFMILCGYSPTLALIAIESWEVLKLITLIEYMTAIKKVEFLPKPFDGGNSNVLAILTSQGKLYFYDVKHNHMLGELVPESEVVKFDFCQTNSFLSAVLKNGDVEVYNIIYYVTGPEEILVKMPRPKKKLKMKKCRIKMKGVKDEIDDVLDIIKLKEILREFGQYPSEYRPKIWEQLLMLPYNKSLYNGIINHVTLKSFPNLERTYPLFTLRTIYNLRNLLNNLVTWCNFFAQVDYLPQFVFPFSRMFQQKPMVAFEVVVTIIYNWCQYWFEYFPLPPVNILSLIENMLGEHDQELLNFYHVKSITPVQYAWPLLETTFSEVLTTDKWCHLWDHILTNETSFLICAVVAYNIVQRRTIGALDQVNDFETFFRRPNPIGMKRFISKTYAIFATTSDKNHPRLYLAQFRKLDTDKYPVFEDYPKTVVENESVMLNYLQKELEEITKAEEELETLRKEQSSKAKGPDTSAIEQQRFFEMQKAYKDRIKEEQNHVIELRKKLMDMRKRFEEEQREVLRQGTQKIRDQDLIKEQKFENLLSDIEVIKTVGESESQRAEDILLQQFCDLLSHKIYIEELLERQQKISDDTESVILRRHQERLAKEIEKIKNSTSSEERAKHLGLALGISAVQDLISKVEVELAKQMTDEHKFVPEEEDLTAKRLQEETLQLQLEVEKLLNMTSETGSKE